MEDVNAGLAAGLEPRLSSSQLETDRSLSDLGNVRVNLDLSGLQDLLQGLTTALDTKFDQVCTQLSA